MNKAKTPDDGDDFHEELARRNKRESCCVFGRNSCRKHFLPKKGARKLAILVRLRQMLESQDPELRFEHLTPDEAPRLGKWLKCTNARSCRRNLRVTGGF